MGCDTLNLVVAGELESRDDTGKAQHHMVMLD